MTDPHAPDPGPRLSETGPIHITTSAARTAAGVWRCGEEEARRGLLALLVDAHAVDRAVSPERWRAKSRTTGWDVTAAVVREPARVGAWTSHPIAVVVGCTVRTR